MFETTEKVQRFVLVAVEQDADLRRIASGEEIDAEQSLDELAQLLETAGGEEAARLIQRREAPHVKTYLGSGKLAELKSIVELCGADGVITDDELSPVQLRNLTDEVGVKVIDRTLLILDIFSQRASTREGQLQVELAQLNYRLTRLTGLGTELSRQGGSVGGALHSRGGGETKLELDRRHIRDRIVVLQQELKEVTRSRETARSQRVRSQVPVVALVGYTNAGKSTLFNRLTNAGVLEENKLFATLDTTLRRLTLPSGREILLCDTVGFIHKLPHSLVKAFRATLEEVNFADILLHVVDASDPKAAMMQRVTRSELEGLGAGEKETILLLNKKDLQPEGLYFPTQVHVQRTLRISAYLPEDQQRVLEAIDEVLSEREVEYTVLIPYAEGKWVHYLNENTVVLEEEYLADGTRMKVRSAEEHKSRMKKYLCE